MKNKTPGAVLKSRSNQILQNTTPLNAVILGRVTWPLLHRMTLAYPDQPTSQEQDKMLSLLHSFSWLYPCTVCATDLREKMIDVPPQVGSRKDLSLWMCEQHNFVNEKLGKAPFKCTMRRLEMMYQGISTNSVQ